MSPATDRKYFTVGHSTRELEEFIGLLTEHGIDRIIDVRRLPGSSRYPQFNEDRLSQALGASGMEFQRLEALTGRRPVSKDVAFETNAWWANRSFHNYADHALSAEFDQALTRLRESAVSHRTALMCAEAVWWRCHRRIIADHLLARNESVFHILRPREVVPAQLSVGAVVDTNRIVTYPRRSS